MISNREVWLMKAADLTDESLVEHVRSLFKEPRKERRGLNLVFPYDLRNGLEQKLIDCHHHTKWTAFMNNKATLVHVINSQMEILVRIYFKFSMKSLSREKQLDIIKARVQHAINLY